MAAPVQLSLIAKQAPQPIGLASLAYSLPPSQITLNYVHSLGQGAPKGDNCSVEIGGKVSYGLKECYRVLGDHFAATQNLLGKDSTESKEVNILLENSYSFRLVIRD
jgi:hypothetical protein